MFNKENLGTVNFIIKKICKFIVIGAIFMWGVFWYLSGTPTGLFKYFYTYYVTSHYFMDSPSKSELFEGSLKGIIESLGEPHSQYLDKQDFESIMQSTEGSYSGVGIVLGQKNGKTTVISAIEDQPAAKEGIQSGDIITKIDGTPTSSLTLEEASKRVRGDADTTVVLTILRDGEEKDYSIVRQRIVLPTVKGKMLQENIGYIRISQFAETTGADFAKTYKDLEQQGMKKLVLDLRNNPGGLVTSAQQVSDYVLPAGPLVSISSRIAKPEYYESSGLGDNLPLVVLINQGSASASEILAGAIQDRKAGTIIGTNSYGKGTVQTIVKNFEDEGIKITIAKYHTPNDRVIDGIGIKPDIEIVLTNADRQNGYDAQLEKALTVLGGGE